MFESSFFFRLRRSKFAKNLTILTSASLLQTLITFGSAPIISRLFTPEEFGVAGLIAALTVLPAILATGQYYTAIGIAKSRAEAVNLVTLSFALTTAGAIFVAPLTFYLGAYSDMLPLSLQAVALYLWSIPAFMLVTNLVLISRLWEIRHASYTPQVTNRVIEASIIALAQIALGLLGTGAVGLIVGRWIGTTAAGLHGLKLMLARLGRPGLRSITRRRLVALSRQHWRFPAYQLPGAALNGLTPQLTPLLFGVLYTLEAVGYYWFASRLLERPAIVLGNNVGRVYFQHAADLRKARRPVLGVFWRSTAVLVGVGIVPFGLVIAFGPPLFAVVFGPEWETAGHYARWIAVVNFFLLIGFPARSSTSLFGFQDTFAKVEVLRAVTVTFALLLVAAADGDALLALAATTIIQSIVALGFIFFVGGRLRCIDHEIRTERASTTPP